MAEVGVAAVPVGLRPQRDAAPAEQPQRAEHQHRAGDHGDDPPARPSAWCGRGRRRQVRRLRHVLQGRRRQGQRARIVAAHVQPERRVLIGHQPGVAGHPQHPPVHAEHEIEDLLRVPAGHQQHHRGDHGQDADQPEAGPAVVLLAVLPREPQPGPGEQAHDDVLRDGQQPPFHQRQPAGQPPRVLDLQVRGIGRVLGQRERRVPVGAERADRVVLHPPGPPQHPHVELEDGPRVAAGDHDRHHRHRAEHDEAGPQEGQHDVVRDHQHPLDQPEPAGQRRVQRRVHPDRVRLRGSHRDHPFTARTTVAPQPSARASGPAKGRMSRPPGRRSAIVAGPAVMTSA